MVYSTERYDNSEALFLARELDKIKSKVYERRYPELKGRLHVPMTPEPAGPGAETFTVQFYDAVGQARIGLNFPRTDVRVQEKSYPIRSISASYGYTFQEIRAAQMANRPLATMKAFTARRAVAEEENRLIYSGSAAEGLIGLFNNPNVPIVTLPYDLDSGSTTDQIIQTFNTLISTPFNTSETMVDTVLMPKDRWSYLRTQKLTNTSDTLMSFLEKVYPEITFDWCSQCTGAGTNSGDILFAYKRSEEFLYVEVASDFEQLPPDVTSTETQVNCHERFGGVANMYPLQCVMGDLP